MKALRTLALLSLFALGVAIPFRLVKAQGPVTQGSETVAKKKGTSTESTAPDTTTGDKIPSKYSKKGDHPQGVPTFSTDALTVTVDVAVLDNKDHFIPKIPRGNFRVSEDNVPQKISSFTIGEAPMTIAMVVEFSASFEGLYGPGWFEVLNGVYGFAQTLRPDDYCAVVAYDMRTEMLSDFSTNRQDTYEALQRLRIPGFHEANLYDALTDTAERMSDIEGRKAILLLSSGIDTFSKLTFDQTRKKIQDAGVPIYAIGLLQSIRIIGESRMGAIQRMDFMQADNQMRTFAKESGGMAFFPRFYQEMPEIFRTITDTMRSQYVLTYTPSNQTRDGKYRKIKVDLINPETNEPLPMKDEKNKPVKYKIQAKAGYTAPREVE
jgi:Ca-activated chloride channel family protein